MSRKLVFTVMLTMLLALFVVPVALADEPAGSCPTGFTLEMAMDHHEHHHQHVGISSDINGDGFICMRHVTPDQTIHVHVDNYLP